MVIGGRHVDLSGNDRLTIVDVRGRQRPALRQNGRHSAAVLTDVLNNDDRRREAGGQLSSQLLQGIEPAQRHPDDDDG
jgi:hypothetical protein